MSYEPPEQSVRAVLALCSPQVTLEKMRAVRSLRLRVIYDLVLSDGTELVLILAPPSMLRLLRSEQCMVQSEAAVVAWARDALTTDSSSKATSHERSVSNSAGLLDHLPTLIRHSPTPKELGSPYNICSSPLGVPISFLGAPLTSSERYSVDFQIGAIFRQISHLSSPSTKFGPASVVLQVGPALSRRGGGANTWSVAFHSMLESILRDGEDMAVMLPYPTIRKHFRNLEHLLDYVETPRLVAMDGCQDSNGTTNRLQNPPGTGKETQGESCDEKATKDKATGGGSRGRISVTGLQDWSKCFFGDPLLASVFDSEPSHAFLQGFSGLVGNAGLSELGLESKLIDDGEHALSRVLLYRMYHAIVCIVSEFYRPRSESSERELTARRRLNGLLLRLGELDASVVDTKRRHRRPTSDMSPAKKPKPADDITVLGGASQAQIEDRCYSGGGDAPIDRLVLEVKGDRRGAHALPPLGQ
ncbi:hypothetical protein GQ53DRAFT_727114 [Thozetella sp. PMI_491]|nr:hypothetical protein GQ53DRAFT_727114 [Thozetella sp. PMI_491]